MPPSKRPLAPDSERVLRALRAAPEGLYLREVLRATRLGSGSAQRLRRLLVELERQGLAVGIGRTKARRYVAGSAAPASAVTSSGIPLSGPESALLWNRLRRPVSQRSPVSYRREFLDMYRPNRGWYLPLPTRERLAALGRTDDAAQAAGTYARHVLERLLIDLSWNSSRLEGNTYSLLDTERLLSRGEADPAKDQRETQMLLNHKAAIEFLVGGPDVPALEPRTLQNLHALLTDNLLPNAMDAGRLRIAPVGISESVYVPLAQPQLLEECFRQLVATAVQVEDAFEQSFFLMVHLSYLQPFIDGNKRTARLAANMPFIRQNLVPLSFVDVDRESFTLGVLGVYEENRVEVLRDVFVHAYERSAARLGAIRASLGEPDPFRLTWRAPLKAAVAEVVRGQQKRAAAVEQLAAFAAEHLPEALRERFKAVAMTELDALHEGNYARYAVRPSEFAAWKLGWAR